MTEEMQHNHVDVAVVGGGPAGVMFAYLAARAGLRVKLLEAANDFNREFRGDTLNPLALRLLEELGLIDEVLALPHGKVDTLRGAGTIRYEISYKLIRSKYPYVMILSQSLFLGFLTDKARQYAGFELEMGARVNGLLEENGVVKGVRYRDVNGKPQSVTATLTIAADGCNSVTRKLANIEVQTLTNQPDDVIWFRMPMQDDLDPKEDLVVRQDEYSSLFMFRRRAERDWQIGITVLKDGYKGLREAGLDVFHQRMTNLMTEFKERIERLTWDDTYYLPVTLKRANQWYRDGLLLIGDSAHIMSPVGGVGINLAIRDAVVAANMLVEPIRQGHVTLAQMEQIQRKVQWDINITQNFQASIQNASKKVAQKDSMGSKIGRSMAGLFTKLPLVRRIPVKLLGYGLVNVSVDRSLLGSVAR
jgi:2-polyprenyl-6-methoxyphenol hydroxylase-like FAD-dependent oxidoreductase